jgi:drug/metabolite transporter (DMT)-like permease
MDGRAALPLGLGFVLGSFALNSVATRFVVAQGLLDPGLTTAARFLAGALALAAVLALTGRGMPRVGRASLAPAAWLGAYALLISYGYQHIGAAAGTFVFYALVLATMVGGAALMQGRAPTLRSLLGGLVALAGVGVLAFGRVEGATLLGVLLLAGTGLAWGAYSLLGRRSSDALGFTAANFLALAVPLVPFAALLLGGAAGPVPITDLGLGIALLMGAITTALSYAVWYWALARIPPAHGATYQLAIPVLTAALGVLLLGEALGPHLLAAGAVVLLGMGVVATEGRGAPAPPREAAAAPGEE